MKSNPQVQLPHLKRLAIEAEVAASCEEGRKLVLLGENGSGRYTAVRHALPKHAIIELDFRFLFTESALETLSIGGKRFNSLTGAIVECDRMAKKQPLALVIRNLDGCANSDEESGVVWRLRSELQTLQHARVFFTASDPAFLGRNVGHPQSALFKQAVIVDVGGLDNSEVLTWVSMTLGRSVPKNVADAIIYFAGRKISDVESLLFEMLTINPRSMAPLSIEEIQLASRRIAMSRSSAYADMLGLSMPSKHRQVLYAMANGVPAGSGKAMAEATGIEPNSLTSVYSRLIANGHLIREGTLSQTRFKDPYLAAFLRRG